MQVVDSPGFLYLIMEHAPNGSLLDYVRARKRLQVRTVRQGLHASDQGPPHAFSCSMTTAQNPLLSSGHLLRPSLVAQTAAGGNRGASSLLRAMWPRLNLHVLHHTNCRCSLQEADAAYIMQQIVEGLSYCHEREVVHR